MRNTEKKNTLFNDKTCQNTEFISFLGWEEKEKEKTKSGSKVILFFIASGK